MGKERYVVTNVMNIREMYVNKTQHRCYLSAIKIVQNTAVKDVRAYRSAQASAHHKVDVIS